MAQAEITEKDRKKAQGCIDCPICKQARNKGHGLAYLFVKHVDRKVCPMCKAYEKVYGVKAYEPIPKDREPGK